MDRSIPCLLILAPDLRKRIMLILSVEIWSKTGSSPLACITPPGGMHTCRAMCRVGRAGRGSSNLRPVSWKLSGS